MNPYNIIVDVVADRLQVQHPWEVVHYEAVRFTGAELMLCGHSAWHGRAIDPGHDYTVRMPVIQVVDYKKKLRNAFLRGGVAGLLRALEPYMSKDKIEEVRLTLL